MNKIEMKYDVLNQFDTEISELTDNFSVLASDFKRGEPYIKELKGLYTNMDFCKKTNLVQELCSDFDILNANMTKLQKAFKGVKDLYVNYYYKIDDKKNPNDKTEFEEGIEIASKNMESIDDIASLVGDVVEALDGRVIREVSHVDIRNYSLYYNYNGHVRKTGNHQYYFDFELPKQGKFEYDFIYDMKKEAYINAIKERDKTYGIVGDCNEEGSTVEDKKKRLKKQQEELEELYKTENDKYKKLEKGLAYADVALTSINAGFDIYENWTDEDRTVTSKILRTVGDVGDIAESIVGSESIVGKLADNKVLNGALKYGTAGLTGASKVIDIWTDDDLTKDNVDRGIQTAKTVFDTGASLSEGKLKTAFQVASGMASVGQNIKDFCDTDKTEEDKINLGVNIALTCAATGVRVGGEIAKTALMTAASAYGPLGTVAGAVVGTAVSAVCDVVADCLVSEETVKVVTEGVKDVIDDVKHVGEAVKAGIDEIKSADNFVDGAKATIDLVTNTVGEVAKTAVDVVATAVKTEITVVKQTVEKIADDVVSFFKKW